MSLARWIEGWAAQAPGKVAIHFEGRDISYAELARRVRQAANALRQAGIGRGDRIAWLGLNRPEQLDLVFACAQLGAMLVPLNWRLAAPEHAYILRDCAPRLLVADPDFAAPAGLPRLAPGGWLDGDDAASPAEGGQADPVLIVYTSGTTGQPKGAVLTQSALFWNAVNAAHAHDLTSRDHVLSALPMFHVGGLNIQTLPALHAGATVTLQRRFAPDAFLAAIRERRPTLTLMVPATMQAVLEHPDFAATDLSCLRLIMTGSSTVPEALIRPFHTRGVPVGQVYGSTETGPIAIYLRAEDAVRKIGSAGLPAIHGEARLADGEIQVRGPQVMTGYWNDPAATAAVLRDGWFATGDLAHRDADGFFHVDDRRKDLIISGGENIYPAELENVLADCAAIQDCAVVARPDVRWGEAAVAIVVRRPGAALDRDGVLALFEGRLARFKHPRDVLFLDSLPRNAMGKVQKFLLRERLANPPRPV